MGIVARSEVENAAVSGTRTWRIDLKLQFELFVKTIDIENLVIFNYRELFIFCINLPA